MKAPVHDPARVIVGEHDPEALTWLSFVLGDHGIDVVTARSVGEVVTALEREGPFDAIVSDIELPGIAAQDLSTLIRATHELPWILVDAAHRPAAADGVVVPLEGVLGTLEQVLGSEAVRDELERWATD